MKKRILFFWPNTSNRSRITLSIPILTAIAKQREWETKYFDTSNYEKDDDSFTDREKIGTFKPTSSKDTTLKPSSSLVSDLQNVIDQFQPDVLAITGMTNDFQYLQKFFSKLDIPSRITVVFGGTHTLHGSADILKTRIDLSCCGQGEYILPKILERIEAKKPLVDIPGTTYIKNQKPITHPVNNALTPTQLWQHEPDYSCYDDSYYLYPFDGKQVKMFWLEVGRGCPYNCTYCEAPQMRKLYKGKGRYVVTRPLDSIFSTITNVQKQHDIDVFNITHECFLSQSKDWLKEFCKRWKNEVGKSFLIQTRMETVTEENLDILRTSNAPIIQIGQGIESGSPRILKDVCNRRMDIEQVVQSYQLMKQRGFRTNAYYMIGFPTETRAEIFQTIDLCNRVNSDIDSVSIFQPYPGLPLTKQCIENGWIAGDETIPSFTEKSLINQPSILSKEVTNLHRVFLLYAKLPRMFWQSIDECERDPSKTQLFQSLVDLRWQL